MRTLLVTTAMAALLATSAMSFAAVHHATGTVKAFDVKAMTLSLASGDTYQVRETFKHPVPKAGENVVDQLGDDRHKEDCRLRNNHQVIGQTERRSGPASFFGIASALFPDSVLGSWFDRTKEGDIR